MLEKLLLTNQIQCLAEEQQCTVCTVLHCLQLVFGLQVTVSQAFSGSLWPQNKMSSDQKSLKTSGRYICQEVRKKISAFQDQNSARARPNNIMEIKHVKSVYSQLIRNQESVFLILQKFDDTWQFIDIASSGDCFKLKCFNKKCRNLEA